MKQLWLFPEAEKIEIKTCVVQEKTVTVRKSKKDYSQKELEFQEAQDHWELHQDKESWDKMFTLINLAVFNIVNRRLINKLPQEEIEGRALDITCIIMQGILKKKEAGLKWKVAKVSSYVYRPCCAMYNNQLKFDDKILSEDAYTVVLSNNEEAVYNEENLTYTNGYLSYNLPITNL